MNLKEKIINKKIIVSAVFLILIVISLLAIIDKDKQNNNKYYNLFYDQNTPILIKENNKYGYISSINGNLIIKPQYVYAQNFNGNNALVKVETNNGIYNRIIDKDNNIKLEFESYIIPKYINNYDLWLVDGKLYNSDFKTIFNDNYYLEHLYDGVFKFKDTVKNKTGLLDHLGNEIFTCDCFIDLNSNTFNENLNNIIIKTNKNSVIYNIKSKRILYETDNLKQEIIFINNNVFKIKNEDNNKWIVLNNENIVYETSDKLENIILKDNYVYLDYGYNYKKNEKKQRYYYYDIKKEVLLKEEPNIKIKNENEYGFEVIKKDDKYGIKKNNKVVLNTKYENIIFINLDLYEYIKYKYNKEIILLYENNKIFIYDLNKKEVINSFECEEENHLQYSSNSSFITIKYYNEKGVYKTLFYNLITNKSMETSKYKLYSTYSNYLVINNNDIDIYYNSKFKKIYELKK